MRTRRMMKVANPRPSPIRKPAGWEPSCRSTHQPIPMAMGMAKTASMAA
jgi:hypothetical protein